MTTVLIATLTACCVFAAGVYMRLFAQRKSALGLSFVVIWSMHYILGNVLTLLSSTRTYTLLEFSEFELSYLLSVLAGLYFLLVYGQLLLRLPANQGARVAYLASARRTVVLFVAAGVVFSCMLVLQIGVSVYFSPELAFFRARLGDVAGEGIGVYYYLASLLVPATMMACAYAMDHPRKANIAIAVLALAASVVFFVPLGGRGRVMNMFFILGLAYLIGKNEYRLHKLMTPRTLLFIAGVLFVSYVWGVLREDPLAEVSTDSSAILRSLSVDLTRLNVQAFILDRYELLGSIGAGHFLESMLGPFMKFVPIGATDLIQSLSARWYHDTIGGVNVQSAISPSFVGETYLVFGIAGLLAAPYLLYAVVALMRRHLECDHPLSLAVIVYFYQFTIFHGGVYLMFDVFVITLPILFLNRRLLAHPRSTQPGADSPKVVTVTPTAGLHDYGSA